jgi:hypothetical protein
MPRRFKISELYDLVDSYKANPGGTTSVSVGQLVFALSCCTTSICMGQCFTGAALIPWGVTCTGASAAGSTLCACGFCTGTGTYVALGSSCACGGTLFRRIL